MYGISPASLIKRDTIQNPLQVLFTVEKGFERPKTFFQKMLIRQTDKWKNLFDSVITILIGYSCFISLYLYY